MPPLTVSLTVKYPFFMTSLIVSDNHNLGAQTESQILAFIYFAPLSVRHNNDDLDYDGIFLLASD